MDSDQESGDSDIELDAYGRSVDLQLQEKSEHERKRTREHLTSPRRFVLRRRKDDYGTELEQLPNDLLLRILSELSAKDLGSLSQVNKFWHEVVSDPFLWRSIYLRKWPTVRLPLTEITRQLQRTVAQAEQAISDDAGPSTAHQPMSVPVDWRDRIRHRYNLHKNWRNAKYRRYHLEGHLGMVLCLKYFGNVLVTGSDDHTLRVWSLGSHSQREEGTRACTAVLHGHEGAVWSVDMTPHFAVSGSGDGTVRLWSLPTEQFAIRHRPPPPRPRSVTPSPEASSLTDRHEALPRLSSSATPFDESYMDAESAGLSDFWDERVFSRRTSHSRRASFRNARSQYQIATLTGHRGEVWCVRIRDTVRPYGCPGTFVADHSLTYPVVDDDDPLLHAPTSDTVQWGDNASTIVSTGTDCTVRLWDMQTQTPIVVMEQEPAMDGGVIGCVQVDGDGMGRPISNSNNVLVSGAMGSVSVWDLRTGTVEQDFDCDRQFVYCLNYDQHRLFGGLANASVTEWDMRMGRVVKSMQGHRGELCTLQYDYLTRRLVTGSADKRICVWDWDSADPLWYTLPGHSDPVFCIRFDDEKIVSGGADTLTTVWDFAADLSESK